MPKLFLTLKSDCLQIHARTTPARVGYTQTEINWRESISKAMAANPSLEFEVDGEPRKRLGATIIARTVKSKPEFIYIPAYMIAGYRKKRRGEINCNEHQNG